jgi:serine phosphatase RsbU (regulator of sigma subunit)
MPAASDDDRRTALELSEGALAGLLNAAHLTAPHELPALVAEHAAMMGVRDAAIYLADLQQSQLVPFLGPEGPGPSQRLDPLSVDSTLAGRAYQHLDVLVQGADLAGDSIKVWVPLLDGTERLGVLALTIAHAEAMEQDGGILGVRLRRLAGLTAELITTKTRYGDTIVRTRRSAAMGLAAEIQWGLLPPLTFACEELVVAAALEPAYDVAGDSIDYAVDPQCARFAVFDAMGHGLQSAQLAALAVAAYRNGRRNGRPLTDTAAGIDAAVVNSFGGDAFATALLAELDTTSGRLQWINAGHPEPLLLRQGRLVKTLHTSPALPFGLGLTASRADAYSVGSEWLEPADQIVFYTDGVIEARSPDGDFYGIERLVDLLGRQAASELPAPETMRRVVRSLLEHQQGQLSDDATLLMAEWHSDNQQRLLP